MKAPMYIALACLGGVLRLHAGTLDVSTANHVVMQTGDTLSFQLLTGSYASVALQFGLPLYPTDLHFALFTEPAGMSGGSFAATLRSEDSSIAVTLPGYLGFTPGYLSSAGFQGDVSTLQGSFQLDSQLSRDVVSSGSVRLNLTNHGGSVALGIPELFLRQDLAAGLSGGVLSAGAVNGSVELVQPDPALLRRGLAVAAPHGFALVPEPGSQWLMMAGGGLLCAVSGILGRLYPRRK